MDNMNYVILMHDEIKSTFKTDYSAQINWKQVGNVHKKLHYPKVHFVLWTLVTNKVDTMVDPLFKSSILCGFGNFRPKWLQCFNNSKWYMVVHCLLSIFQVNKYQPL